ncbi:MAG: hypothetical protein JSV26_03285, partial [bacterium]
FTDHHLVVPTQTDFDDGCSQCHSVIGSQPDQSSRRCDACHTAGNPYTDPSCTSCHGNPPNGNAFPNRDRRHGGDHGYACAECHGAQGSGSGLDHYEPAQAHLEMALAFTQTATQVTCTGTCHGETHNRRNW